MINSAEEKIDFVIFWVDGNDPEWQKEFKKYKNGEDEGSGVQRFREWGNLKYLFRGIEKYTPWVNKVFFVTWGHVPKWLDCSNPKIEIVKHEDYIPKEYLPTFNANPIELNFHRIKGLSEQFVVFNDDFFILDELKSTDFFVNGKPKDMAIEYPIMCGGNGPIFSHILCNDFNLLGKYYKRNEYKKNLRWKILSPKYGIYFFYNLLQYIVPYPRFFGMLTPHFPRPYLKSVYKELWALEESKLKSVCNNKLRDSSDVNMYIFRLWNILKGNFIPTNVFKMGTMIPIVEDDEKIYKTIEEKKYKLLCLNDACKEEEFEKVKNKIIKSFENIFPEKCGFEK